MSLLSARPVALHRHRAALLPPEIWACFFHSTVSRPVKQRFGKTTSPSAPSRTRLVKDLTPKNRVGYGKPGRLEVAPRPSFVRDKAPHPEAQDSWKEREARLLESRPSSREDDMRPIRSFQRDERNTRRPEAQDRRNERENRPRDSRPFNREDGARPNRSFHAQQDRRDTHRPVAQDRRNERDAHSRDSRPFNREDGARPNRSFYAQQDRRDTHRPVAQDKRNERDAHSRDSRPFNREDGTRPNRSFHAQQDRRDTHRPVAQDRWKEREARPRDSRPFSRQDDARPNRPFQQDRQDTRRPEAQDGWKERETRSRDSQTFNRQDGMRPDRSFHAQRDRRDTHRPEAQDRRNDRDARPRDSWSSSRRPERSSHLEKDSRESQQLSQPAEVLPDVLRLSGHSAPEHRTNNEQRKPKVVNPLTDEFDLSTRSEPVKELPAEFTSPPLMQGLLDSVVSVLGPEAKPSPIQALSLKHLFTPTPSSDSSAPAEKQARWRQFLLASETGSGKSMAYLLPMLQDLKLSELDPNSPAKAPRRKLAINPRALVLAPTHELSRQLAGFAKDLLHNIKLRVLCASRANVPSTTSRNVTASKMAGEFGAADQLTGEFEVRKGVARPVDVLVGTPTKVLEMVRGRGWDHEHRQLNVEDTWDLDANGRKVTPRKWTVGPPEAGLEAVEWVVVDEADVLFDPDFQESTRMLLADIAAARGQKVPYDPELVLPPKETPAPLNYPFHLLLTTATIPSSLAAYLDAYHPSLTRLASPQLHHLPSTLQTEYASWTGGNRNADIEQRIRRIWYEDASRGAEHRSKVLVFCNKSTKVEDLGRYLADKGVPNVPLTSTGGARKRGSNHHLDGFLRVREEGDKPATATAGEATDDASSPSGTSSGPAAPVASAGAKRAAGANEAEEPHVLITTSLLSRGLDFAPSIRHVFIVDEPRNMIDFLHRAGRSGRAGERGKVVVFGKLKGRGSARTRDVRVRVNALAA